MPDPVSYTNRRGQTYYLCAAATKTCKKRYVMSKTSEGALTELPPGYTITENVNGLVSIARARPRIITDAEEALVQAELSRCGLDDYRCDAKGKYITVYEPLHRPQDYSEMLKEMGVAVTVAEDFISSKIKKGPFEPVMRFDLVDPDKRIFEVRRMTYCGTGGWMSLHHLGPLRDLTRDYLPLLGKESFYELW